MPFTPSFFLPGTLAGSGAGQGLPPPPGASLAPGAGLTQGGYYESLAHASLSTREAVMQLQVRSGA